MTLLWQAPLAIALWLCLINWPVPPGVGLDASWQQMLVDAWQERRRFGPDFIFTYGPSGALFVNNYLPGLVGTKILFEIVGKLFVAIALVDVCARLPIVRRAILAVALLLLGWTYVDPLLIFVIVLVTLAWLLPASASFTRVAIGVAVLTVVGLAKLTFLVLATVCVACAAIVTAATGHVRRAAFIAAGWMAALIVGWLAAGQRLGDVPEYFRLSREISAGYADAMYIDETWPIFGLGVALLVVHAAWLLWFLRRAGLRAETLVTAACLAVSIGMTWKLGFIRADRHVVAFFAYSIWLVAAAPALTAGRVPIVFVVLATALSTAGLTLALADDAANVPSRTWQRVALGAATLTSIGDQPARFERGATRAAWTERLPNVRQEVGIRSIDYVGDNQALVFLNGLTYRPRPVPQSYVVYTPALATKNFEFIQSARRPEYILTSLHPIDGRFGGQYDAMLMAELPRRYEGVLVENGQLLLKQRAQQPAAGALALTSIVDRAVHLGEDVTLPPDRTHALWLEVDAHPSLRGGLRSYLYKPAGLTLTTLDDGKRRTTFRLVAGIGRAGFIVQPPLFDGTDVEALMKGEIGRWLTGFTIDVAPGAQAYWEGPLRVRISRLEGLPLRSKSPFAVLVEKAVTNLQPEDVTSSIEWRLMLDAEPMLFLHAPGAVTFRPPAGQRQVAGRFGILDGAYEGENRTDGVEFSVAVVRAGGAEEIVFARTLQPLTREGDRGPQSFAIDLPADPDLRVIIRTGLGVEGDAQWDWSYVSALRFTSHD